MSDLINRDSLLKKCVHIDGLFSDVVSAWDIAHEPTIDAVPVRRGKWGLKWDSEKDPKRLFVRIVCSECNLHTGMKSNFCPNCGADMREEDYETG